VDSRFNELEHLTRKVVDSPLNAKDTGYLPSNNGRHDLFRSATMFKCIAILFDHIEGNIDLLEGISFTQLGLVKI